MSQIVVTQTTNTEPRISANGNDILVCGTECELEVTGKCGDLKVMGHGNRIKVQEAGDVRVMGNGNQVQAQTLGSGYISGADNQLHWGKGPNGAEPATEVHGTGNKVTKV